MTIVERAQRPAQAEKNWLEVLFEEHVEAVYAYVLRRTNVASVAEDIASDVFSDVFRHPDRVPGEDPRPWLFGLARRKLADHYRKSNVRREIPLVNEILSTEASAMGLLIQDEAAQQLRLLISRLPEDQREALLLHYVEGMSAKQIAVTLRRTTFAVNSLLQRARKRVAEQGQDYFNNGSQR